jgi:hypothetical protein
MRQFQGPSCGSDRGGQSDWAGDSWAINSPGTKVMLAEIEQLALDAAEAELRVVGTLLLGVRADISCAQDMQTLAEATVGGLGAVHVLCINPEVGFESDFAKIPLEVWEWALQGQPVGRDPLRDVLASTSGLG